MSDKRSKKEQHPLLESPVGRDPVNHPHFVRCFEALQQAVEWAALALVLGHAGVGKSFLGAQLVRVINDALPRGCAAVRDADRLSAAMVVAPSSQRGAFSWKALWVRLLRALEDPMPWGKINRDSTAASLRAGARRAKPRSEAEYFDAVCDAARDRGLSLLVIDEAYALTRADRGRTLADQLDVLRELSDVGFSVVLLSTFRVVPKIVTSGEIDRRMTHVILPRYAGASAAPEDASDYMDFCSVALTFMEQLPEQYAMHLSERRYRRLYNGSLGCVGVLSDWVNRAVSRCARERPFRALDWEDFEETALPMESRARMMCALEEARDLEELLADAALDIEPSCLPAPQAFKAAGGGGSQSWQNANEAGSKRRADKHGGKKVHGRVGIPDPSRPPVPSEP